MNEPPISASRREALLAMGCGRHLGRYTLLRRVAVGGMAEVYLAVAPDGQEIAIKKILPQFSYHQRFVDMLVDEARLTVCLNHENLARVLELDRAGEDHFLVMEFVDGPAVNGLLQRVLDDTQRPLEPAAACYIMAGVAAGLHHAHQLTDARGRSLRLVHRDVSPQNILLTRAGGVKLIDFGIARARGRVNQTGYGVIKGKLRYLAPEIVTGLEPDPRADIFCCGIVLYELLSGQPMYRPRTDAEAIELAAAARIYPLDQLQPGLPAPLTQLVMRCLARDPIHRPATAGQLSAELRALLSQLRPSYGAASLAQLIQHHFAADLAEEDALSQAARQLLPAASAPISDEEETLAARPTEQAERGETAPQGLPSPSASKPRRAPQRPSRSPPPKRPAFGLYVVWGLGALSMVLIGFFGMVLWIQMSSR